MQKIFIFLLLFMTAAWSFAGGKKDAKLPEASPNEAQISALGAIGKQVSADSGPMYTGNGGKGIRLAILAPEALGGTPDYLPLYIQGLLNSNFRKYSEITLIDRQNLDKVIAEQNIASSGRFSDKDFLSISGLTNTQYFLFGSIQKLSGDKYSLQLSITDSSTGVRKADFMKDGTLAQIEGSGILINEAAAELLVQMGVNLTADGKQSLLAGSRSVAQAEAGLAKGITAQTAGSQIEALFNFTQSIAFDPSQIEAVSRLNMLSSTISEGSIGQRILSDFEARDRWLEAFKETALFFNKHPPFEITFDPNLVQDGELDYVKRTANLAMRIALDPSEASFGALNALLEGLEKTGRRTPWGFSGWPLLDINPKTKGTVVFEYNRSFSFKVEAALINEKGKTIGKSSAALNTGSLNFSAGDKKVPHPNGDAVLMRFPKIKAEDLTPTLTIVIMSVNGIPSAKLSSTGYMRIDAGDLEGKVAYAGTGNAPAGFVRINGGTFTMGSPANEASRGSNETQHQVTVSSFSIGKYPVTQKEYQEVMGSNPSYFKGDNLPVERVSWYDAVEYCNKRSQKEGLTPAYTISGSGDSRTVSLNRSANGYRLPTEAEWEYACRAGTTTAYNTGASISDNTGWYSSNSGDKTHPVGQKTANAWGLYDMHGNVWEWCWDWYGSYASGAQTDPVGASSGSYRVGRGGGWYNSAVGLRSASRSYDNPGYRFDHIGFRLVRP